MRTPEQIRNLRMAFSMMPLFGPAAFLVEDKVIDALADRIQGRSIPGKIRWEIKVRLVEEPNKDWVEIKSEPVKPVTTFNEMSKKCDELLAKYQKLDMIEITDSQSGSKYYFGRD